MTVGAGRRAAALVAAATALLVVAIAWAVHAGWTGAIDAAGVRLFRSAALDRPIGPSWLSEAARDLTALGSNGVLGLLVAGLACRAWVLRRGREAIVLIATFAGGLIVVGAVKTLVQRARPDIVEPAARVFTTSFPSSHATMSAVVCTVLALLGWDRMATAERRVATVAAIVVCAAVGASRVYLGVHWPSDVLSGWLLGMSVATLSAALAPQQRSSR